EPGPGVVQSLRPELAAGLQLGRGQDLVPAQRPDPGHVDAGDAHHRGQLEGDHQAIRSLVSAGHHVGEAAGGEETLDAPAHRAAREGLTGGDRHQALEVGGHLAPATHLQLDRGDHRLGRNDRSLRADRRRGQEQREQEDYSTFQRSLRSTPRFPIGTSLYTLSHWITAETRSSTRYSARARVPFPETGWESPSLSWSVSNFASNCTRGCPPPAVSVGR